MFTLPKLPYTYSALEPYIDEATMRIHHTKHHQGYVDNLNKVLEGSKALLGKPIEELLAGIDDVPQNIRQAVINHGGGHANHSFFWQIMSPKGTGKPNGALLKAIESSFTSLDIFKEKFTEKAMSVFGSGWAFLMITKDGNLTLKRHSFQNSPLMQGNIPILGIDVWEHAYYLKYQNRRADYIQNWWQVVNWNEVNKRFNESIRR